MKNVRIGKIIRQNRAKAVALGALLVLTVLMLIPVTRDFLVGVFGWAACFYLAVGYFFVFFGFAERKRRLRPSGTAFLILTVFCAIATLHVLLCDRAMSDNGFIGYITGPYGEKTVGGVVMGLFTCFVVVPCRPVWAVIIYLLLAAVFGFLFLRPFIFAGAKEPLVAKSEKKRRREKPREVTAADSIVVEALESKVQPKAFNVVDPEPETPKQKAQRCLFGGDDMPRAREAGGNPSDYFVRSYFFGDGEKPDERKEENGVMSPAALALLGEDGSVRKNDSFRLDADIAASKPAGSLFADEPSADELFEGTEEMAHSPFAEAIRQKLSVETAAPSPITPLTYEKPASTVFDVRPAEQPKTEYKPIEPNPYKVAPSGGASPAPTPPPAPPVASTAFSEEKEPVVSVPPRPYRLPPTSLLKNHVNPNFVDYVDNWDELKETIEVKLKNYNVDAKLIDAIKGPTVTRVTIELADTCSIKQLRNAQADLQRLLRSPKPINILQQIGMTSYCGIEIPNAVRNVVGFKSIINSKEYQDKKGELVIALGKSTVGEILIEDLAKMPHALIAGTTGSGKSVCINVILASLLCRYSPSELKLILIDMKEVELGMYSGLPHMLFKEPLSDLKHIVNALLWIREETKSRFVRFKSLHVRNLDEFNDLPDVEKLPRIVIVIDEASELMSNLSVRKTLEATLSSLARMARAAGVHLLFATQNPVKEVITNEIQNNLNTKIAFAVGDYNHSMVIFKAKGAESLLGNGDMYIKRGNDMVRGQCAYISTEETDDIVHFILENNDVAFDDEMINRILNGNYTLSGDTVEQVREEEQTASYVGEAKPNFSPQDKDTSDEKEMWDMLALCFKAKQVSVSYLQRKFARGYNTIAKVMDFWEEEGAVSSVGTDKRRGFLWTKETFVEKYFEKFGVDPFGGETN